MMDWPWNVFRRKAGPTEAFTVEEGEDLGLFKEGLLDVHRGWIRGDRQISWAVPVHLTQVRTEPGAK